MNQKIIGLTLIGCSLICFTMGVIGPFDKFVDPVPIIPDGYTATLSLDFFAYDEQIHFGTPLDNVTIEFYQVIDNGHSNYQNNAYYLYNSSNNTQSSFSFYFVNDLYVYFRFMKRGYWPTFYGWGDHRRDGLDSTFGYSTDIEFLQKPESINMTTYIPFNDFSNNSGTYFEQLYFDFSLFPEGFIKSSELYKFTAPNYEDEECNGWEGWDEYIPVIQLEFNQTVYQQAFKYSDDLSPFAMEKNVAYFEIRDGWYIDCQELHAIKVQNTSLGFINATFGYLDNENDIFYSGNQFMQGYPSIPVIDQVNSLQYLNSTFLTTQIGNVSVCFQDNTTGQWNCTTVQCVDGNCTTIKPWETIA
jgi:hypothetical protein